MKLKRRRLIALGEGIAAVGNLKGIKFAYAMSKNNKKIVEEVEDLAVGLKPSKRFKEYNEKRLELCGEYADKNETGGPKMRPVVGARPGAQEFVGLTNNEGFRKAFEELKSEYKDELDLDEKLRDEYDAALDEEVEFEPYMVKLGDVPEEITTGQLNGIIDLVTDDDDSPEEKAE